MHIFSRDEHSACGVGFIAHRRGEAHHSHLRQALKALKAVEHRGACAADQISSDGAGIMTDIPFELLGYERGKIAVAFIFMPTEAERQQLALQVFEDTFAFLGLDVLAYREVPVNLDVLGPVARESLPAMTQAIIARPRHCRTDAAFEQLLYTARQHVRTQEKAHGIVKEFFFASLSANTIVYKALTTAADLPRFYLDLQNPAYTTRFALFHRRFSTNTRTAWDKVQPFRMVAHNGEINTIAGNRSWAYSREKALGLRSDELLTHKGISDSGSLNEMAEALKYRSAIPHLEEILAIMMPPADQDNRFYTFWSRAMEPWDGPAIIACADGFSIGARLDRNGFRPARWCLTEDCVYLCSEAGAFALDPASITAKGALHAGTGMTLLLQNGELFFRDPGQSLENRPVHFDPNLLPLESTPHYSGPRALELQNLFQLTREERDKLILPMAEAGKEPIGSMGDTARLAVFSDQPRSFFDFFYQSFAQVTNPPLDYLRERMVTDLRVYLGARPNIFAPKELLPPEPALLLDTPLLSLNQMQTLQTYESHTPQQSKLCARRFEMTFPRHAGLAGFEQALSDLSDSVQAAVAEGVSIVILSDQQASADHPPLPALLALRQVVNSLNRSGQRLRTAIVVHSGSVRSAHHVAALIGFGAAAVCPYLALEVAAYEDHRQLQGLSTAEREQRLLRALEDGLLKIMAKSGISVVRAYQSAKRFSALGLGPELIKAFFPGLSSPIGGLEMADLVAQILSQTAPDRVEPTRPLLHTYLYREHNKESKGEKHAMTARRSRALHSMLEAEPGSSDAWERYQAYLQLGADSGPVNLRHLLAFKPAEQPLDLATVEPAENILRRFGAGAMSFGAISAEAQRDIFIAMQRIGGRSNSGEGGENPYYFSEGISATTKQVASGRFGVTAEYLASASEIQIKIAQGAKPGEGGQLMGLKVTEAIAKARYATPGTTLISPPPLHDIYSIEDLKQLIYELKQLKPDVKVSVKLVAGHNVGTIAVGVAKAGADIIYVCGYDGGTGAAVLGSMKHAGLPWELGLLEAHRALAENHLRHQVELRTDGGLHTGADLVMATLMGAEGFEFGKLLLIAEGCIMARVCEKNTCPRGIATHDPKFQRLYQGSPEAIEQTLRALAEEVRQHLASLGLPSLETALGRTDLLQANPAHAELMAERKLDMGWFLQPPAVSESPFERQDEGLNPLNQQILKETAAARQQGLSQELFYPISTRDRAIPASLAGALGEQARHARQAPEQAWHGQLRLTFRGSAGQGFGVFLTRGVSLHLFGEANDSVGKSMSGGQIVISPHPEARFEAAEQSILGNCALYGATGGRLYAQGRAGDRFAVRNSGATAVVEGAGLHCCEYMTQGLVLVLGPVSDNAGAGMTGGVLFLYGDQAAQVNPAFLQEVPLNRANESELKALLDDYLQATGSARARAILEDWAEHRQHFHRFVPLKQVQQQTEASPALQTADNASQTG